MRVTDYSKLSIGTNVDNGEIMKCPHCGQNGLAENVQGMIFYTHLQACGFNEQGNPDLRFEWCPKRV